MGKNGKQELGKRIANLRKDKDLSQAQLAKFMNIGTSTLGMYETGKREPNTEILSKIADFFDVSVDYLLGRNESTSSDDNDELDWTDFGMAYGGHIPDELKDMYKAIAKEYVRKHPESMRKDD